MMRLGFVVNPVAGMGGRVGLKGTDGKFEEAVERGAEPRAPRRGTEAAESLVRNLSDGDLDVEVLTPSGVMGEEEVRESGISPTVVFDAPELGETSAEDTRETVRRFVERGVDLILFVGGDGTALDVHEALSDEDALDTPVLGVPAGVKVYSSVFAVDPERAGRIAAGFDPESTGLSSREVNDIDEEEYRRGEVVTELKGVLNVPSHTDLQANKQKPGGDAEGIARGFADDTEPNTTYVLGPGSTLEAVKSELGFEGTPLGVDLWHTDDDGRGEVVTRDATEDGILESLGERNVVVVSPVGGQGFVLGRGNHQISPEVVERSELEVVATREKLRPLDELRVDLDDEGVEEELRGWVRVRTGRGESRMMKLV
ncbi:MAG: ATP-NAD kinase family protein [Halobacteria archaeon]|nr:ATP-NAD kinase family protein [Halobacteria archaeon]